MDQMCNYITPYKCKRCGSELLFFVTHNKTLVDYKKLFMNSCGKEEIERKLRGYSITHIKCMECGKDYIIDWSSGYPEQLTDKMVLTRFGVRL